MMRQVLTAAADWLDEHQWCQRVAGQDANGHYTPPSFDNPQLEAMCVGGAIYAAAEHYGVRHDYHRTTRADDCPHCGAIRAVAAHVGQQPNGWNDHPDRTRDEVVTTLRTIVARLDPEEVT